MWCLLVQIKFVHNFHSLCFYNSFDSIMHKAWASTSKVKVTGSEWRTLRTFESIFIDCLRERPSNEMRFVRQQITNLFLTSYGRNFGCHSSLPSVLVLLVCLHQMGNGFCTKYHPRKPANQSNCFQQCPLSRLIRMKEWTNENWRGKCFNSPFLCCWSDENTTFSTIYLISDAML